MPEQHALTLAYMRTHPAEAAQTLDAAPGEPVAALLLATPARIAAPVLAEMAPARAADALQRLPEERAAELLAALGTQAAIAVLRHLPESLRHALLQRLPTPPAMAIRLLLAFPQDSVGAICDPAQVVAGADTPVADALRQVRSLESAVTHVLVVDVSKRLLGWSTLDTLLRAPEAATLGSLAVAPPAQLPATMPVAGALASAEWSRASVLPVVDRSGRLVGLLSRDALTRAAARMARRPAAGEADESLAGALARSYLLSTASLLRMGMMWLPQVPPLTGPEHGD